MTEKEILKKAIEKAIRNGFKLDSARMQIRCEAFSCESEGDCVYTTIFSHDFAKALWGDEWKDEDVISTPMSEILEMENIAPWQHHLRKMVILENPVEYLEQFLVD